MLDADNKGPTVWALLGARAGDNRQVLALAEALDWPYRVFELSYNPLFNAPNWLLRATLVSVRGCRPRLTSPWPDLVIGIGQRSVPVARWIERQSGGRAKLARLGRPRAPLSWFDLIVTTPQYGLPARNNVMRNPLPLHGLTRGVLEAAAQSWRARLAHLPEPRIALLLGGPSWPYRLTPAIGRRIGAFASELARAQGGSLMISTSPRTPSAVADALTASLSVAHALYRWDRERGEDNPYLGFIALAERILVTEDSVSGLAEACATGRPVTVLPLEKRQWGRSIDRFASGPGRALFDRLASAGVATPPSDIGAIQRELVRLGLAQWEADRLQVTWPLGGDYDPMRRAVKRTRDLMDRQAQPSTIAKDAADFIYERNQ